LRQPPPAVARVGADQLWLSNRGDAANRHGLIQGGEIGELPIGDRLVGLGTITIRPAAAPDRSLEGERAAMGDNHPLARVEAGLVQHREAALAGIGSERLGEVLDRQAEGGYGDCG
jgi:hypothetical protein